MSERQINLEHMVNQKFAISRLHFSYGWTTQCWQLILKKKCRLLPAKWAENIFCIFFCHFSTVFFYFTLFKIFNTLFSKHQPCIPPLHSLTFDVVIIISITLLGYEAITITLCVPASFECTWLWLAKHDYYTEYIVRW